MKKIVAFIVVTLMLLSSLGASAKVPDFMKETYNNYTASYSTGVKFRGADSIVSLLDELEMPEEVYNFVDIPSLLEGLLSHESNVNIQCDMSDDYQKIDVAVTTETKQNYTVNTNLNADMTYGYGLWMHVDFTLQEPEFLVVYTSPLHNKYGKIDLMKYITEDEVREYCEMFKSLITPEYINRISESGTAALEKYATISQSGNRYTVHLNNDGFVNMISELFDIVFDEVFGAMESTSDDLYAEIDEEIKSQFEAFDFSSLKILGDKGLTWIYEVNPRGKIDKCTFTADIDLNISEIYSSLSKEEWEYTSRGEIGFDVKMTADITNVGKTKPYFPELTEENSFDSMIFESIFNQGYDYEQYPASYVYGEMEKCVEKDGLAYFPLEETMKKGYRNSCNMEATDTTVTMESPYFKDFTYVTVSKGKSFAITDDAEYDIGEVIENDGTIYVSEKFFVDVLGWELSEYSTELVNGIVTYGFYNTAYYEDDYYFEEGYEEEYEVSYPYEYVWVMNDGLVEKDGLYYVPLRLTLENGYDDTVDIEYKKGKITLKSDWFEGFEKVTLNIGEKTAYADGKEYKVGEVLAKDGVTYVSTGFFEDIFGWSLKHYSYDRIGNYTDCEFATSK